MIFSKFPQKIKLSEFLMYLIQTSNSKEDRIPPLSQLSKLLGVSTTTLREQLEEAKTLGLVEAKPKSGIRRLDFSFSPAVWKSLTYATILDSKHFAHYSDLRNHIEESYWFRLGLKASIGTSIESCPSTRQPNVFSSSFSNESRTLPSTLPIGQRTILFSE